MGRSRCWRLDRPHRFINQIKSNQSRCFFVEALKRLDAFVCFGLWTQAFVFGRGDALPNWFLYKIVNYLVKPQAEQTVYDLSERLAFPSSRLLLLIQDSKLLSIAIDVDDSRIVLLSLRCCQHDDMFHDMSESCSRHVSRYVCASVL